MSIHLALALVAVVTLISSMIPEMENFSIAPHVIREYKAAKSKIIVGVVVAAAVVIAVVIV